MGYRRRVREYAMGYLYQEDTGLETLTSNPRKFVSHFGLTESEWVFFQQIVEGVLAEKVAIDVDIQEVAEHWKLSRMARVDRVVLRLACWELKCCPDTPLRVIIDEAVEIARRYSTTDSASFVNGILDRLAQKYRPEEKKTVQSESGA
ncbi:MAG: transcription antitermination factor NusB [Deltaproteobacteria bacterium CG11_big_fil_rev_8_21_14_0_20_45_16]|nr:MAG: transcription antitermination factor NusB [Deltaproteobacteria bacterium CG11_big_fil_rev_8_21_14_0_20_45_16]